MVEPTIKNVAVVGTGVIGRSWIYVFARAGCRTRVYDRDLAQTQKALAWFEENLKQDIADRFITGPEAEACRESVSEYDDLRETLSGAEYIQESGPESIEIKQTIFAEIDRTADPSAIIASSTSALDINSIAAGLPGISRCIMAHPFNPPHIVPVVEVMPTRETDPEVTRCTTEFLKRVGQKPVLLNSYVVGHLAARFMAAVAREAIYLVESGVADVDAVDTVIHEGLGLRWALLGSFGVSNSNADGGVREYFSWSGKVYKSIMRGLDPAPPSFDPEMIERIAKGVDAMEGDAPIKEICRWRDRMVRKIRALKEVDPHP